MDTFGHALYGVTICSRTGLAGGRRGAPIVRGRYDWTAWTAAGFALLPDMASIGVSFTQMLMRGAAPSFHGIPPYVFVLYHFTHSLITAGLCVLLLRTIAHPFAVPALAWPTHILIDTLLHGEGRWQTPMFFPFSDWRFHGINWWKHSNVVLVYWGILPVLWLVIHLWRRRTRMTTAQQTSTRDL